MMKTLVFIRASGKKSKQSHFYCHKIRVLVVSFCNGSTCQDSNPRVFGVPPLALYTLLPLVGPELGGVFPPLSHRQWPPPASRKVLGLPWFLGVGWRLGSAGRGSQGEGSLANHPISQAGKVTGSSGHRSVPMWLAGSQGGPGSLRGQGSASVAAGLPALFLWSWLRSTWIPGRGSSSTIRYS